jgi:integrase
MAAGSIIKVEGKRGATYAIRFYGPGGKRCYKTIGPRKGDAQRALRHIMSKVDAGEWRPVPDITFAELAGKWLELKSAAVRPKALASYRAHVDRLIAAFGPIKVKNILSEEAERFFAGLLGQGLAPATNGRTLTILKSIFEKGGQWGYLTHNPARYINKPQIPKREMAFLNPEEMKRLIAATDGRHRTLIMSACYTGMRQSEILGLTWGDIDWQSGRIYIRRGLQQGRFFEPKTQASKRAVVVPPVLVEALKGHRRRQAVELAENRLDLVFPNRAGRPMASRNLAVRIFEPALRAAGLPKVTFHALRHSYVSLLLSQGESVKFISRQVGHSSAKLTLDVYGHLLEGVEEAAMGRLEERLRVE